MLIPKEVFGVAKVAAKDPERYALDGIRLERDAAGHPRAVATDGRRLLAVGWQDNPDNYPTRDGFDPAARPGFAATLEREGWAEAERLVPKGRAIRANPLLGHVALDEGRANGSVSLLATDLTTDQRREARVAPGEYVPYRNFLEGLKGRKVVRVRVSAELLAELLRAMRPLCGADGQVTLEIPAKEGEPLRFLGAGESAAGAPVGAIGVLMPICADDGMFEVERERLREIGL